jgi:kynurenine formamidase
MSPHDTQGEEPPLHNLGVADVLKAISLIRTGRVFDLERNRWPGMPMWSGHPPFQVLAYRTPRGMRLEGDLDLGSANALGAAFQSELVMGTVHTGTHIDALCHCTVGADNHWFGAVSADERAGDFGPLDRDATSIPPLITRGVLIDVAGAMGVQALPTHTQIGRSEIEDALAWQGGTELRPGDTVLIRTGYLSVWPDPKGIEAHHGAGVNLEGAEFLLENGLVAVAGDTESIEAVPSADANDPQPLHRRLLNEAGVYMIEMVDCEGLARERVYEFCFVCLPLKIKYATGSMVRPVAII